MFIIWLELLCLAGKINDNGLIYITKNMDLTITTLSTLINRPEKDIDLTLYNLGQLEMITVLNNGHIEIINWEKHQNTIALDRIREQTRERMRRYRARIKESDVTLRNGDAIDKKEERRKKKEEIHIKEKIPYQKIIDLYNSICLDLPKVQKSNDARNKTIKARWLEYEQDIEVFKKLFTLAQESNFLCGRGDKVSETWSCGFDWLVKKSNMPKVLEGNYKNKTKKQFGNERKEVDYDALFFRRPSNNREVEDINEFEKDNEFD